MSEYLKLNTEGTFTNDPDKLVKRALEREDHLPESFVRIVENTGHLVTVELKENNKKVRHKVNVGADVGDQSVDYYDKQTSQIEQKMLKVREIRNYEQMVDDINWLGLRGVLEPRQAEDRYEYYRFGDWVISFDLKNFYVGDHFIGRISADKLPKDIEKALKAFSLGKTKHVTYGDMLNGKNFQLYIAKQWIYGNNDEVASRKTSMDQGRLTLAMFVSESIRNFRTHVINMMAIEIIADTNKRLTTKEFIDSHPMARGGTWPNPKKTGFEGLNEENRELVLPLELNFIR